MSLLKDRLKSGKLVIGTMAVEFNTPNLPRMLQVSGFEYVIVDCEHGYFDYGSVANMIAVAKGWGMSVIVRIPDTSRTCILKYMDMGASGLLVPMVSGPEDMQRVVEYAKYRPLGKRGVALNRTHAGYEVPDAEAYMRQANEETILLGQIETIEGLERVNEICAVAGLDGMLLGPNDLLQDIQGNGDALSTETATAHLTGAISKLAEAAQRHTIWSGIISSDQWLLKTSVEHGMQLLSWSSDVRLMMAQASKGLRQLEELRHLH
ncbi:HpcH/HpaI aldolase family protein [Paenibacillus qinlingensis]|uniref:HpcH/HpaI aldolase family protein n=1 Tax=Paenibacillus qinlingensis TaxID=1837343 RepID=UPI0015665D8B|nr:aldolase/citrate lyase family protein [Paenibacillus qinlingensis]NQX58367.1 hypothetical protein [Paenibacillus qinlingensis]